MNDPLLGNVTLASAQPTEPLTLESLELLLGQFKDAEVRRQVEHDTCVYSSFILIQKALEQGIITNEEYESLSANLVASGGLIASFEMLERLRKVKVQ